MAIECVTIETNHLFPNNPIAAQHQLRYRMIIERQNWDVPVIRNLEYDQYDNPSTIYLIWRDHAGIARGMSRLYPTDRTFMLQECFSHTVQYVDMPRGADILEGSRFCIDNTLPVELRKRIAHEIILAYLEYGLSNHITKIIGIMYPVYWRNLFEKNGWPTVWIGDCVQTPDGKKSRSATLEVSHNVLKNVQLNTGIMHSVITYGSIQEEHSLKRA